MINGIRGIWTVFYRGLWLRLPGLRPTVDSLQAFQYRQRWGRQLANALRFGYEVHGPLPGPGTLIVSTHSGFSDVHALFCVLPPEARVNYISKLSIGRVPIVGWHMWHYQDIIFDRTDANARRRALVRALARLRSGFSVVLFPEGTRSRTGQPQQHIRPALIEAAVKEQVAIQPVAIHGTRGLMENPFKNMRRPTKARLYFGPARRDFGSVEEVWREVLKLWEAGARSGDARRPTTPP